MPKGFIELLWQERNIRSGEVAPPVGSLVGSLEGQECTLIE